MKPPPLPDGRVPGEGPLSPELEAELAVYTKLLQGYLGHAVTLTPDEAQLVVRVMDEATFKTIEVSCLESLLEGAELRCEAAYAQLRRRRRPAATPTWERALARVPDAPRAAPAAQDHAA